MSSQDSERPVRWHVTSEIDASDFHMHGRSLFLVFAFLAVVVLTSFLVLYTRWVCRNHRHHFPSHASPQAPPSFLRQGLHPAIIKSLPITLHESAMISDPDEVKEAAECCICLGEFEDGDKVKIFPVCRHSFHSDCLDRWLAGRSTCPLCRTSLDGADLSILTE